MLLDDLKAKNGKDFDQGYDQIQVKAHRDARFDQENRRGDQENRRAPSELIELHSISCPETTNPLHVVPCVRSRAKRSKRDQENRRAPSELIEFHSIQGQVIKTRCR